MRNRILAALMIVLVTLSTLTAMVLAEEASNNIGIPTGEGKRIYNPDGEFDSLDNGAWYFFLSDKTLEKNAEIYGDKSSVTVYGEVASPYYNGGAMTDVVFSEHLGLWTEASLDYALWIPDSYVENPDGNYALVMNNPVSQRDNVHPAALTRAGILTVETATGEFDGGSKGGTDITKNDPTSKVASDYFISKEAQDQVKEMWGLDGVFVLVPTITNAGRVQDDATVPTQYSLLLLLCDALLESYPINTNHIYGTGQSVGGMQLNQINTHRDNFLAGFVVNGPVWYSNFYKDTVFNGSMMVGEGNTANPARIERHYTLTDDRIIWEYDEGGEYDWLAYQNLYYMTSDDNILTVSQWEEWNLILKGLAGYEFAEVTVDNVDGSDLLEKMSAVDNTYNGVEMGLWQVSGIEQSGVGNAAIGRWLLNQVRTSENERPKLDINKPFDGTPGTEKTSTSTGKPNPYQYEGLDYFWVPTAPSVMEDGTTTTNAGSIFYNSHLYDTTNAQYQLRPAGWLPTVEQTSVSDSEGATPLLKHPVSVAKIESVTKVSADGEKLIVALEYNVDMENAVIYEVNDKVQSEYWFVDTNANKNGFDGSNYPRADFVVMDSFDFYDQDGALLNDLYDIEIGNDNPEYITAMKSRISKIYISDVPEADAAAGDRTGSGRYVIIEIDTSANPDLISVVQRAPIVAPKANALAPATFIKLSSPSAQ